MKFITKTGGYIFYLFDKHGKKQFSMKEMNNLTKNIYKAR